MAGYREGSGILSIFEAEGYVQQLCKMEVSDIGTDKWMQQHEYLEKLNIQAHHNALSKHDEFVVEAINSQDKLAVLVHDLLCIEFWREKLFPILRTKLSDFHQVKAYIILYHEATLCNLLEVLMYHESVLEGAEDCLAELTDYCYRKMTMLASGHFESLKTTQTAAEIGKETAQERLSRQALEIGFSTAVSCLAIVRFITQHINHVPLAIMARIMDSQDMVLTLVPLVENPPWTRQNGQKLEKFVDQKWMEVVPDDRQRLTKTEAQVWLSIYNLMMEQECRRRYQWNTHRKETVLALKRHFNEVLIDQLPLLADFRRFVEELALLEPPPPTQSSLAIVEQMPEIRAQILTSVVGESESEEAKVDDDKKWGRLAAKMMVTIFTDDEKSRNKDIARLASTYNLENFDEVLEDPKCALCGSPATNRCSKCKMEWYCGRECQVAAWKKYHKEICKTLCAASASKVKEEAKLAELS